MNINLFTIEKYVFTSYTELPECRQKQVYNCRTSDEVRMQMVNSEIFSFEEHLKFVDTLRHAKNKIYWAICEENTFLLSISLHPINWSEQWGEWGIYINPQYKGKGIAKRISKLFFSYIAQNTSLEIIKAKIKLNNIHSIHFHHTVGFISTYEDDSYIYMDYRLKKIWEKHIS
jgi:RimJ/RimL family protein N-acetyltransferase